MRSYSESIFIVRPPKLFQYELLLYMVGALSSANRRLLLSYIGAPSPLHVTVWGRCALMAIVFVLINSEVGAEKRVMATLQAIEVVTETFIVQGVYDIIAKLEAPSMDLVKSVIFEQIRNLPDVRNTLTMVVVETSSP
ncbi:MAG: Lrp/AsnC ligand binding domain-containing protein [Candidatus Hodarchaeales archaeon]